MKKTSLYRINKFLQQTISVGKCPEIRWDDVTRIEAFGTDAISAFAIVIKFHYIDGTKASVHPEEKGYFDIVESLDRRFPSIRDTWFAEMLEAHKDTGDDVDRVLLSSAIDS